MEQSGEEFVQGRIDNVQIGYRKSWTAYLRPVTLSVAGIVIGVKVLQWSASPFGTAVGWAFMLGSLLVGVVTVLRLRNATLYFDDTGVWLYQGLFPWEQGVVGVRWADLGNATVKLGFFSWVVKSYTVRVGHRYTRTSGIVVKHLAKGTDAVARINEERNNYKGEHDGRGRGTPFHDDDPFGYIYGSEIGAETGVTFKK